MCVHRDSVDITMESENRVLTSENVNNIIVYNNNIQAHSIISRVYVTSYT